MQTRDLKPARLASEQLATMATNGIAGAASGLLGALAIGGGIIWTEDAPVVQVATWLGITAIAYAFHVALCIAWRRQPPPPEAAARWCNGFAAVAFAEGVLWCAGIIWFCASGSLEQELIVVLIAGGIAGAVGLSFGSYLPAYFARFLPAVLPYVAWAAVFSHGHAAIHDLLAVCVFLFAIGNVQLARGFNASFIAVQNARFENSDLAAELRVQKEAAEAATLAKSRFLAAASHDLRQPVHALSLFVGALHGTELPADAHRLLDHIQTSVASVDGLFASLLDISRLDAGVVTAKAETFPIQPLLERIARDHAADAAQKHIALRLYASSAFVVTDQLLLERVLRNLVSNAIRYTDHGRVVIGCRRHGDAVSVQVLDTGRGIPAAAREQIFEEFHQLHEPGNERNPGLGLGLAIVRRLCELLSLPLSLTSTESRGSCFSVDVPLAASPTLSEAADEPGILTQPAGLILVIDDNDGIREAMGALLRRWGHETIVAASGETMLALADRTPDLIIADYHLGQSANGLQTIAALRKHFGATVPAMIITGDTALDVPDILVLRKPVPHARLRASVLRLLRKEEALLF